MADSDDEYDRKRRDKFRGERGAAEGSSYRNSDRREERSRGRDDWPERYAQYFFRKVLLFYNRYIYNNLFCQ
jgi:hypothetical protein